MWQEALSARDVRVGTANGRWITQDCYPTSAQGTRSADMNLQLLAITAYLVACGGFMGFMMLRMSYWK